MKKNLIIILVALISGALVTSIAFLKINNILKYDDNMVTVFQIGVFKKV